MSTGIMGIQIVDVAEGPLIHVFGWAGACTSFGCKRRHWMASGWVTYWPHTYQAKAWAAYNGHHCRSCPHGIVEPLSYEEQKAFHAAYALGGDDAIRPMVDKQVFTGVGAVSSERS